MAASRLAGAARARLSRLRVRLAPRRRLYHLLGRPLPPGYGVAPPPPPPLYAPASFDSWVLRSSWGRLPAYPDHWRTKPGIVVEDPATVAVLMHVYFLDLVPEILEQLKHIPVPYDLIVTNSSGFRVPIEGDLGFLRNHRVLDLPNHGRDIWPTVAAVNSGILNPYLVVLKVHTKRSAWRADHPGLEGTGELWRRTLLADLLGERDNVVRILTAFREDPTLGVVTSRGSALGPEFWGDNERNTSELARRLEIVLDESTLSFPAGSMYWCRGIVLQGLRSLAMVEGDFEPEGGQVNATTAHAVERLIGVVAAEAGLRVEERPALDETAGAAGDVRSWERLDGRPLTPKARFVPFYLPQFHPFEENDRWWSKGFTEWTNVVTARPVFHGQYQPRLPTELGFYDLRLDTARAAQAELARFAGVEGFMYYYYWFAGRRLLATPIEMLLRSDLDFPFCIMWANENWTRRWDGASTDVLIGQDYENVDPAEFLDDVAEFLRDRRYLRIDDRPVLSVYRPNQLPDFAATAQEWRRRAHQLGIGDICLLHVDVGQLMQGVAGTATGEAFDGSLAFPPHNHRWSWITGESIGMRGGFAGNALDYSETLEDSVLRAFSDMEPTHYPGAMVTFDNTARRPNASDIWYGSNPYRFRRWLADLVTAVGDRDPEHRLIFINAWNEWAEAAVLEPTDRHGSGYLLALRDVAVG